MLCKNIYKFIDKFANISYNITVMTNNNLIVRCAEMTINSLPITNIIDALVPISRFNKGEANKIFDEVREMGCKIVVKNNAPACVLLTPEKYQEMLDAIEDQYLLALAEERIKNDTGETISFGEHLKKSGTTMEELEKIPMEYGVDFE